MPTEPTHKLYLDDSGTKEYNRDPIYPPGHGNTAWFGFGGLLIHKNDAGIITADMHALKKACFGTHAVEIKANWLKRPQEREKRYLKPYGITDAKLDGFVDSIYAKLPDWPVTLIACIVNKAEVQSQYKERAHYAPAIAYDCLMQRVQIHMNTVGGIVHTTVDDMDGATPKGRQYRDNLQRHHQRLRSHGSMYQKGLVFDRIDRLDFADSKADERLQVADLVAHNVYKQFVLHGPNWEISGAPLPAYDYFNRMAPKFRQGPMGRVQGYGIIKFPLGKRVVWRLVRGQK